MAQDTKRGRGSREFVVPERHYSGIDAHGHRQLLHRKGQRISWDEAIEAGLADQESLSPDQVSFTLQHSVIVDGHLVHRAGTVISLAEAIELGVVDTEGGSDDPPDGADPDKTGDDADPDKAGASDGSGAGDPDPDKAGAGTPPPKPRSEPLKRAAAREQAAKEPPKDA